MPTTRKEDRLARAEERKEDRHWQGAHNFLAVGDGKRVYVSNRVSNTVTVIDQSTLDVVDTIPVPGGPDCMEATKDGKATMGDPRWIRKVTVIDLATKKVIKEIPVGKSPHGIYFSRMRRVKHRLKWVIDRRSQIPSIPFFRGEDRFPVSIRRSQPRIMNGTSPFLRGLRGICSVSAVTVVSFLHPPTQASTCKGTSTQIRYRPHGPGGAHCRDAQKHNVKATFFLANEKTQRGDTSLDASWKDYWSARQRRSRIGSHTWDHWSSCATLARKQVVYARRASNRARLTARASARNSRKRKRLPCADGTRLRPGLWRAPGQNHAEFTAVCRVFGLQTCGLVTSRVLWR